MPYLELTPELVGPRRSRIVLAMIETAMLWPHDEDRKSRAWKASLVQHAVDIADSVVDFSQPINPGDFKIWNETLLSFPSLDDIQEDAKRPFIHGMTAGFILYQMISLSEVGSPVAQLTTVKKRILADLRSKVPQRFRYSLRAHTERS